MSDVTVTRHPAAGEVDAAEFVRASVLAWREKHLQQQVVDAARKLGWTHIYHTYFSDRSEAGFPDLVLAHPGDGRIVFAELKTMKGRVTERQASWLNALASAQHDGTVRVCTWRPCCWLSGEIEAVLR